MKSFILTQLGWRLNTINSLPGGTINILPMGKGQHYRIFMFYTYREFATVSPYHRIPVSTNSYIKIVWLRICDRIIQMFGQRRTVILNKSSKSKISSGLNPSNVRSYLVRHICLSVGVEVTIRRNGSLSSWFRWVFCCLSRAWRIHLSFCCTRGCFRIQQAMSLKSCFFGKNSIGTPK